MSVCLVHATTRKAPLSPYLLVVVNSDDDPFFTLEHVWQGAPARSKGASEFTTHPGFRVSDIDVGALNIDLPRQLVEQNWCTTSNGTAQSCKWCSHPAPSKASRQWLSPCLVQQPPRTASAEIIAKGKASRLRMVHVRRKYLFPNQFRLDVEPALVFVRRVGPTLHCELARIVAAIDAKETRPSDGRGWYATS